VQAWSPRLATASFLSFYEYSVHVLEAEGTLLSTFITIYTGLAHVRLHEDELWASGGVAKTAATSTPNNSATPYGMRTTSVQKYRAIYSLLYHRATIDTVGAG
jgi:hypothetical protein